MVWYLIRKGIDIPQWHNDLISILPHELNGLSLHTRNFALHQDSTLLS